MEMDYPISGIFLKLCYFLIKEVEGIENFKCKGSMLICSNHESYLDPFLLHYLNMKCKNKKMYFLSMKGRLEFLWMFRFFDRIFRKSMHVLVYEDDPKKNYDQMKRKLNLKEIVGLFPGGKRVSHGMVPKGKTGAVRLAMETNTPIIPVGIRGAYETAGKNALIPRAWKRIEIKVGKPLRFEHRNVSNRIQVRKNTKRLMLEIADLAGKKYKG